MTSAVQGWYDNSYTNHGISIQSATESSIGWAGFITSEHPYMTASADPIYTVSYRDIRGLDDRWAYSTHDVGIVGKGNINLFSGNLAFVRDDINTAGAIIPITVSGVYNSYQSGLQFTADSSNINAPITAPYDMNVGYGWKLSVCESVIEKNISGNTWLIYNDADGTELSFFDYSDGIIGNYQSEDGYALTITIDNTSEAARYVMIDDYNNTKKFNSDGFITSIEEIHGQKKFFEYSEGKLTEIKYYPTEAYFYISQLRFLYNSNGALCKIENAVDPTIYVEYYYATTHNGEYSTENSGYLRHISYSSGESCTYIYDALGRLRRVENLQTNERYQYTYIGGSKAYIVRQTGSDGTTGESVRITYENRTTKVRDTGADDVYNNDDDLFTEELYVHI